MNEEYTIHKLMLPLLYEQQELIEFLQKHQLQYQDDIEEAFGVFDCENQLVGCGCCAGSILKCFAVNKNLRGQNITGLLISRLVQNRFQLGVYQLFVMTRPENIKMFTNCGFYTVAQTETVAMLENQKNGVEQYISSLILPDNVGKTSGAVVMNCNPFTNGHRALVEYAASHCELLHLFVVEEERSQFPFADRFRLVQKGTEDLHNVHVHPSGPYIISASTFPTYFLKKEEDVVDVQSRLDITLFASRIAPPLGIHIRFVGQEPLDPVTAQYNQAMRVILEQYGITFVEIPRITLQDKVVSASRVRRILKEEGITKEVLSLVPVCTQDYLLHEWKGFAQQ